MRASEDIKRVGKSRVQFTVDADTFEDELIEAGVYHEGHDFVAYIDFHPRASITKVLHLETGEDLTHEFDLPELVDDIFFAAMRNEKFNGGEQS